MPRTLTLQAVRQSLKEHGSDPFLVLLTIVLQPEAPNITVVNNTEDLVSRGVTFIGCPFSISLPDTMDYVTDSAEISIDNVDTRIWQGARMLLRSPDLILEVVMGSDPNTVVLSTTGLKLREAQATSQTIQGKLMTDTVWQVGFPAHEFDPSQNPGMFTT